LNCFLYDIRERSLFVDQTESSRAGPNGSLIKQRPPRRIDLSYMMTAWAREPEDEHRILGRTLAAMYRGTKVPSDHFQGVLVDSGYPLLTRVVPAEHVTKPADLWGVLDNELRTAVVWVVTAPLEVLAPTEGPLVRSRELRVGEYDSEERHVSLQIAGRVHTTGDLEARQEGVRVSIAGSAHTNVTRADGIFKFSGVAEGSHTLRWETADGKRGERAITVPDGDYDIEL
jgi:hypothetical protein